jgi:heterodisulfide reductase subunit B
MLKFMSDHTRKIKISNKTIREKLGVTLDKEKIESCFNCGLSISGKASDR